jgi:hypothetical protein
LDPLLTNRIDPSLLRVIEKHSSERDATSRRRRGAAREKAVQNEDDNQEEEKLETPKHSLDDLA